ncbi:hypothetical protein F7725_015124 [Dissostichus mawsoni]|uniref:Uncharacterized protein n=1 Tax=Dissostichus mawsoni TaxID=36200 RepID=A0A7J5YJH2_DISMA|nr:hypothetical protein F7725_015124 [Dissostichus mawsoni]
MATTLFIFIFIMLTISESNPLTVNMMKMKSVVAIAVFLETVSAISILQYSVQRQELADRGNVIVVSIGYRAISQSGVAVSPWTINKDPRQYAVECPEFSKDKNAQ